MYIVIKYSKMKYKIGFPMPARNGIEIYIAPYEFISAIKLSNFPST
jgi:hypothetical protein